MSFWDAAMIAVGAVGNAAVNLFNGKKNQKANEESRAIVQRQQESQEKLAQARMMMEHMHHQDSLTLQQQQREADREHQANLSAQNRAAQAREGALARQHQAELTRYNQEFQTRENLLSREMQEKLAELNRDFQAQQGEITRAFTEKMELFRADLQKYLFLQQRELQLELKELDVALARELRSFDRETALAVIQEQKRQQNSPIWLVAEDLLYRNTDQQMSPLHVFFSPPHLKYDQTKETIETKGFPLVEQYLQEELRKFFMAYQQVNRPIDYLAGAWTSKRFSSEAAARQIFQGLGTEPTLIIESALEGENLSISFGYWGLNYAKERYFTAINFSWLEVLYDFAKARTLTWLARRAEDGSSEADWIADYGEDLVRKYLANQAMIEREERCLARNEDLRELTRNYHIALKDQDDLKRYIAVCHCIFAGLLADEYFLLDVAPSERQAPLMPLLLPDLLAGMMTDGQTQLIEAIVAAYDQLYQQLVSQTSDWEPELRLELALSLAKLPNFMAAQEQIDKSIQAWLKLRNVQWQPPADCLAILVDTVQPEDRPYIEALQRCWVAIERPQAVDFGPAFYRRGQDFYKRRDYVAAIADFDRAIELGVMAAIDRKEIALQVMADVAQREVDAEKLRQAEAVAEKLRQDAATERQRQEADQRRLAKEAQLAKEKKAFEDAQGKLFSFEVVYVDHQGKIDRREQKEARCLAINLGNGVDLPMVYVPGGSFQMGSTEVSNEQPVHQVTLSPFHLGKYPVTQQQYQAIMGNNPAHFKGDKRPVEQVSWHDAVAFCQKLSEKTGKLFRLASEAQWEYACRAGTTTPFYFGATISSEIANYDATKVYGSGSKGQYRQQTTDVGSFPPNAFGLYDLHGNVWEWCQDTWHGNYQGAPVDGSVWNSGNDNDNHCLRGGAWYYNPYFCRSAYRSNNSPDNRDCNIGFRVVLAPTASS